MRRLLPLGLGLALGLVLLAPARLLLPAPPLAATRVDGSLWRPHIAGLAIGQLALPDLALALAPAELLKGRLHWQASGSLRGGLWRGISGGGASGLSGRLAGSPVPGLPITAITLAGTSVTLAGDGACRAASGQVTAVLAQPMAGQASLAGAPRCDGAALLLPLASADGRVQLELRLTGRHWRAGLAVTGAGPAEAAALASTGFAGSGSSLTLQQEGTW